MADDQAALTDWRYSVDLEGIAWAIFDREGESANALGRRPLEELSPSSRTSRRAPRPRPSMASCCISGKDKSFIVGADIREFDAARHRGEGDRGARARSTRCSTASRSCRCLWSRRSTALASAAASSWSWPATTASPRAMPAPASASPRSSSASSPASTAPCARSARPARSPPCRTC